MVTDDISRMILQDFPLHGDLDMETAAQDYFAFHRSKQFVPFPQLVQTAATLESARPAAVPQYVHVPG